MAMSRRNLLQTGAGGLALSLARGASYARAAQSGDTSEDLSTVVIGVDGSSLTAAYVDEYISHGATVWQYSDNIIDFDDFQTIDEFVNSQSSKILFAKCYNDILTAKQAGKVALVVGIQECTQLEPEWFANPTDHSNPKRPNNWDMKPPVTQLPNYYAKGLRMANLAYNLPNFFGGGCLDARTPLSSTGAYLVDQMREMGILVDCSHSSDQTTLDIIARAKRPVVCSHSNPNALDDNPRNISDDIIRGIAGTGGLIGANALSCFLLWSRKDAPYADKGPFPPLASISQYVDVVDYITRLVGVDFVGIESDFTYPNPQVTPPPSQTFLYPPEMTYNQPKGIQYVKHFKRVGDLPYLRAELVAHGYSTTDIAKILGGNWMRVFREAWNS